MGVLWNYELILKFIWKCKGCSTAKIILKKENKTEERTLLDFMTDFKAPVITF